MLAPGHPPMCLGNRCACRSGAREHEHALLDLRASVVAHADHGGRGRPRTDARPLKEPWPFVVRVSITQDMVEHEAWRKACWIGGTPILSTTERSDQA
jgi:hypothetical protein